MGIKKAEPGRERGLLGIETSSVVRKYLSRTGDLSDPVTSGRDALALSVDQPLDVSTALAGFDVRLPGHGLGTCSMLFDPFQHPVDGAFGGRVSCVEVTPHAIGKVPRMAYIKAVKL